MKNKNSWKSSKYLFSNGKLIYSKDKNEVGLSSRLMVALIAAFYSETIPQYVKGRLIDLGCGLAPMYAAYMNHITEVTCVDWSNDSSHSPYIDFEQDLNQPLSFADESFDTVLLTDVLEHIRKPDCLLAEIQRIMSTDGVLLLNVPFFYWIHDKPFDYFRYTEYALKAMLEDNGFEIIRLQALGGSPEVVADISSKIMARIPIIGNIYAIIVQKFIGWFVKTNWGRKVSERSSKTFPLAYAVVAKKRYGQTKSIINPISCD